MDQYASTGAADFSDLLQPHDPLALAVQQTILRGSHWAHTGAPVADQIAIRLAGAIVRDQLQPGQRLLEKNVSESLRVSRAPVREAFRILERERLIEFEARRGAIVVALNVTDLCEIFMVRSAMHQILFTQLMAERRSDLHALLSAQLPALRRACRMSTEAYVVGSYLLNLSIINLCSNRLVVDLLTSISLRTLRHMRLGSIADPAGVTCSLSKWRAIQAAAANDDTCGVLKAVHERMEQSRQTVLQAYEASPAPTELRRRARSPRALTRPE